MWHAKELQFIINKFSGSYEWKKISFPEENKPSPSAGHSFSLVKTSNGELFGVLFGGYSGIKFLDSVALYDFGKVKRHFSDINAHIGWDAWRKVEVIGSVSIEARSVHSAVSQEDIVYVWSGNVGGTQIYALKVYGTCL